MKTTITILSIAAGLFLASCNSKPSTEESLKDEAQRKEIMTAIAANPDYSKEMTEQMMKEGEGKQMMCKGNTRRGVMSWRHGQQPMLGP